MTRLTLNYTEFKSFLSEPVPWFHVDARIAETKDAMAAKPVTRSFFAGERFRGIRRKE